MNPSLFTLRRLTRAATVAAGLLVTTVWANAQAFSATAEFRPTQIAAGQAGNFLVTITATNPGGKGVTPECTPPSVPGLQISYMSMQQGMQSVMSFNGPATVTYTFTLGYQVRAERPGHYAIPAFDISINGRKITVPATGLEVTDKPVTPPVRDIIGLNANVTRLDAYVGEKLPLDLSVYWRRDLQPGIAGDLEQDNDAFERVQMKGRADFLPSSSNNPNYNANVWHVMLTPIKAGPQKLSFSLPLQITIPDQNGFGDPLVAQLMGPNSPFTFGEQRMVTAQSLALNLNVQPLPATDRPEHFTGGIGTFTADEPNLSSTSLQVGVPVTLTLKVSGEGNFDRFNAPQLDLGPQWRTYPPKDTFTAQDVNGYRGIKTFEYVVMPMAENITSLPAPDVNFFNPQSKSYVTLPIKPIPVTVKPAEPGQPSSALPAMTNTQTASDKPELIPLRLDAGTWQGPQPQLALSSPVFWASQAAPAILFAGLLISRRRQLRLQNDPAYARRLRARKLAIAAIAQARAAAAKGNAQEFYAIAQRALQEAASHDRLNAAEALTWQEFDDHLAARNVARDIREQAREIFEAGDALRFGGYSPTQTQLADAAAKLAGLVQILLGRA